MHAQVLRRMELRTDLADAIARDEFVLHYQPIVDLDTGRTRGLEALVRWQHPTRGMVPPLEFIEIAEESGLIVPLGDWVMRHSIEAAAAFRDPFVTDPPYISVNVSVRQFRAPGFVDRVFADLDRAGQLRPGQPVRFRVTVAARQPGSPSRPDGFGPAASG